MVPGEEGASRIPGILSCLQFHDDFPSQSLPHKMLVEESRKKQEETRIEATGIQQKMRQLCLGDVFGSDMWHSCIICPLFCYSLLLYFVISLRWAEQFSQQRGNLQCSVSNNIELNCHCLCRTNLIWSFQISEGAYEYKRTHLFMYSGCMSRLYWSRVLKNTRKGHTCASSLEAPRKSCLVSF